MRNFFSVVLLSNAIIATNVSCKAAPLPVTNSKQAITLAENGRSAYVIALATDAIPSEITAASELQNYLKQSTGATLPIKKETAVNKDAPQILVGAGTRAKSLLRKQNWGALKHDGILLKRVGQNLVLAGDRPHGTLYAVYEFLEKNVGVRWWTPTESTIPTLKDLQITALDTTYTPPFFYREHFTRDVQYSESLFATRMRENGHFQTQGEKLGGHYSLIGWCHTFDQLLPPEKYFKAHPEWYGDPSNGNKPCTTASPMPKAGQGQLNLTNESMRRELTKNALAWIRKNPAAGIISITQNDNYNYCRSEGDMAVIEREGSPSGPLLELVNKVAADIEKEYPDFLVETLAYSHTRKPPKTVKPRKNVIIRLCSIEADFARPLDSEANADFRADLTNWRKIAPNLYVWDYMTNFVNSIWPHPNLRVLGPNLRYFAREKVGSVFEQGDSYSNGVGDFVQLRTWLVARLLWNPQLDDKKTIDEFLKGYYGAAAPHLRHYLDGIQDAFLKNGGRLNTAQFDSNYLSYDVVKSSWRDFEKAQKAVAGNAVLSQRVRRERLVLDNVIIQRYEQLRRNELLKLTEAANGANNSFLPTDIRAFADDFLKTAHANKVDTYREGAPFSEFENQLKEKLKPAPPLPVELRDSLAEAQKQGCVIDAQENQIRYFGPWATTQDDPQAVNGKATQLTGDASGWALQYPIEESREVLTKAPWHIYAVVRIKGKADSALTGPAFNAGVYDEQQKKGRHSIDIGVDGALADGNYHVVDLGKTQLDSGCYFYLASANNPAVEAIYVDRFIFVRDATVSLSQLPANLRVPLQVAVKEGRVMDIQEDLFQYFNGPATAATNTDPAASNGKAGRIIGDTDAWAIQNPIEEKDEKRLQSPFHVYAVARVAMKDGATPNGQGFVAGIYGEKEPHQLFYSAVELNGPLSDGKYHVLDLGTAKLSSSCYFYISGLKRADVAAIYLDRLILVREQ